MSTIGFGQSWFAAGTIGMMGGRGAFGQGNLLTGLFQMLGGLFMGMMFGPQGGAFSPCRTPNFGGPQGPSGFGGCGPAFGPNFNPVSNFLGGPCAPCAPSNLGGADCSDRRNGGGPSTNGLPISQRSIDLIRRSEGYDQPGKWPGAESGVTIGVGYDLGHVTREQFRRDWGDKLPPEQLARLESAIGLTGQAARARSGAYRDINIPRGAADKVFEDVTLPTFYERTRKAFPGLENLPPDVQGALTSLVFNRGESMANTDRRREMRNIRQIVASYRPGSDPSAIQNAIARELRSMKRIWAGQGVNGLLVRRDAEANLVAMA